MLPVQILLLNLLSDFPMIAISTDSVDGIELRSPKSYNVREIVLMSIMFGMISTVFDFIFFALFYRHAPAVLQTNWFIGSALTELAFAVIEGKQPDIPKETQEQALQIFYNNIMLAYVGRTPTGGFGIVGERTRDVFYLKDAVVGDNHITIDWLVEP